MQFELWANSKNNLGIEHWIAIKNIFKYLMSMRDYVSIYSNSWYLLGAKMQIFH